MWQTPKTDWKWVSEDVGDFFEYTDYNRIKGNIEYLHTLGQEIFRAFHMDDMGNEKESRSDYPYADEINLLSTNLENLVAGTVFIDLGTKVICAENELTPGYTEWNRIENATLEIYNRLNHIRENKPRLPRRLGLRRNTL